MKRARRHRYGHAKFLAKKGAHGTLYRFIITYKDSTDPVAPIFTTGSWAYNEEHVLDKFYDTDDTGWKVVGVRKMTEREAER